MRKGGRIRSLTLLYHGRFIRCVHVHSMTLATSQVNNASICRANPSLYTSALISSLPTELRRSSFAVPIVDQTPSIIQFFHGASSGAKNADAHLQSCGKIAPCKPVHDHVIGDPEHQDLHLHAAPGSYLQSLKQRPIRHNIGIAESNRLFGALNRSEVPIANGEREAVSIRAEKGDVRIKAVGQCRVIGSYWVVCRFQESMNERARSAAAGPTTRTCVSGTADDSPRTSSLERTRTRYLKDFKRSSVDQRTAPSCASIMGVVPSLSSCFSSGWDTRCHGASRNWQRGQRRRTRTSGRGTSYPPLLHSAALALCAASLP